MFEMLIQMKVHQLHLTEWSALVKALHTRCTAPYFGTLLRSAGYFLAISNILY